MYNYNAQDLRNPNRAILKRAQRKIDLQNDIREITHNMEKAKIKEINLNKGLMNKERLNILHDIDVDGDFGLVKKEKTRLGLYDGREFR